MRPFTPRPLPCREVVELVSDFIEGTLPERHAPADGTPPPRL